MAKKPAPVTETELAILELLWKQPNSTIREIVEGLYDKHTAARHATAQSLLDRLSTKGFVECDATGFMHRYIARISREEYVSTELQRLATSHFGGAFAPLLMSLIDKVRLRRKERDAIRKIIESIPKDS